MTFFVLQAPKGCVLATDTHIVPAYEVQALDDALALVATIEALRRGEAQRVEGACRAGWEQGLADGQALAGQQARAAAAQALADTLDRMVEQAAQQHEALSDAVITLSLLVVRRLAAAWPRAELLATLVTQVLDQIGSEQARAHGAGAAATVLVRVHPALLPELRTLLAAQAGPGRSVECHADDTLAPLDCVLETPAGRLLAGLEAQLQRIQAVLRESQQPANAPQAEALA